jgi:hypothetical protein
MIDVTGDEKLELAMSGGASRATAVDEVFLDATDFCDVKVGWNGVVIGQDDVKLGVRMRAQGGDEGERREHGWKWEGGG